MINEKESAKSRDEILAESRSKLSEKKLALLEKLKGSKLETKKTGIPRRSREGFVPLSFAQQRLWFLDQLVPNSPAYNVVAAFHLSGELHTNIMEQCVNEIVERHEALRTTFQVANGEPYQLIAPALQIPFPIVDLTGHHEAQREDEFRRLAKEESMYVFDLTKGPLLRVTLFRLGEDLNILLLNVHHIIIDGWSVGVFFREMVLLYQAYLADKPSPLPELPIQYADFSSWQREWLQGEVLEKQLSYWRETLGKESSALELPVDRTRPPIQTFQGGSLKLQIPSSLSHAMKALSEQENATLYMVLITALKILLHRYSGQNDIRVGVPVANRNRVEMENLVGFFVNTLVLKTDVSGNQSFRELLSRVRETANSAYRHQDVPFERLVDELQPERNMSQNPLFEVCFVLQNFPMPKKSDMSALGFSLVKFEEFRNNTSKFDLWIQVVEKGDILDLDVEFNSDIFNESTISRLLESFTIVLAGIVANPNQPISDLPILTTAEEQKLLVEWNDTKTYYPQQDRCLHEMIEAQAAKTPDAPAVIFEEKQLTYRELDQRANQLANHLVKQGVSAETLVGIYMERSFEMIIGLLGILKAGGAYVPLDPSYPQDRVAFMITDANPSFLLTAEELKNTLPEYGGQLICLDSDWETISMESHMAPASGVNSDNLAYMIYTSGSTGKPKGAMNAHRGIVNRLLWMQEQYQLNETDRVMQKTPFSFDVSVWEFFWPLMTGACMVVARPEGHKDTTYLARLIKKEKITTMHFVPSMLQVFLEETEISGCDTLRQVICSGEALSYATQERFFECLDAELHNLYGPTEAAIDVTYWACQKGSKLRSVPIGRPVANTQIYLLDEHLNPVPVGVAGELHIGGVQLARGYYNRPELTEEKFIPDPFSKKEGARLYKTGDLARYMPDGTIEYLGRIDFMVKLRGFRIELGEIEAVLDEHPHVQKAAVIVHESEQRPGHKQLISYIVPDSQAKEKLKKATEEEALPAEQVSEWQDVFDKAYDDVNKYEADFNITSWNSSYTGHPLLAEEMREWVNSTVDRILALQPKKVLEIGCGTGLLLSRIAPHCEQYWGTDFSSMALDYITANLINQREDLSNVTLRKSYADDFRGLKGQKFDVIVLNSVVQYFPDASYLLDVLKKAIHAMNDKGAIFVGDVRNLSLLQTFLTEVEMEKSPATLTIDQLQHRVQKRMRQEQELVIDPAFFYALQAQLHQISHVEIKLKRGSHHNELTRYRYDVVLHLGKKVQPIEDFSWLDWHEEGFQNIDGLRQIMTKYKPQILGLTNIPNLRLDRANRYQSLLADKDVLKTVEELRTDQNHPGTGIDPEELWQLGAELRYSVDIAWMGDREDGSYEAVLRPEHLLEKRQRNTVVTAWHRPAKHYQPIETYANDPLTDRVARQFIPELRSYLRDKLPDYMVPSIFEFIKEMPVNMNGKLDRKALPAPLMEVPEMEGDFVPPTTETENILANVWAEILGLDKVGIHNNFFGLGGDSIHTIRVVARAKQFGLELTPQQIFQFQTIAELAEVVGGASTQSAKRTPNAVELPTLDKHQLDRIKGDNPYMEDVYPLTIMQENMLYRYKHHPEPGLNVVHHAFRIEGGPFHVSAFEQAWKHLIQQFPALRTSFIWEELDEPMQIVHEKVDIHIKQEDWRDIPEDDQHEQLQSYIQKLRQQGFEMGHAPHAHLALLQVGEDVYYFIYVFNLMLQDGWSYTLIVKRLFEYYQAFSQGTAIDIVPVYPYRDYVALQKGQDLTDAELFWKKNLKGMTSSTLEWAQASRKNISADEPPYSQERFIVSPEVSSALLSLSKKYHLTPYTLVQGAWALLLHHYSGKEDVVFGTIFSGRSIAMMEVEHSVGLFFNILPIRVSIEQNMRFLSWLQNMQSKVVETSQYEYTPLKKIYEWCDIPRDRLLFDSYLVSEQLPDFSSVFRGFNDVLGATIYDSIAQTEHPLRVEILFYEQVLVLHINYYRRFFNDKEISGMLQHLNTLLEGLVTTPEQKVSELINTITYHPQH
ncbi:amino acid adenylation domain-containing protein [Brevibacillus sp. HB1.4B]|uniref:non-ribosomal peptide synthetase n=1 Tax=Brevibacillus sp. HB1.4B TaxID=2738845 RepID=UPI00156B1CB2|nr:non-ribosomal peptide synthetase [Brevibacillus sp. HB1.4B]NRS16242.1 amino acid adenylation domain-containing protein [Brevibacillus sp. HB1.4B]